MKQTQNKMWDAFSHGFSNSKKQINYKSKRYRILLYYEFATKIIYSVVFLKNILNFKFKFE